MSRLSKIDNNCGKCHTCGTKLIRLRKDGADHCPTCKKDRYYKSHGWMWSPVGFQENELSLDCPK